jgi:pyridoxamine 5'-phosphate oxidase
MTPLSNDPLIVFRDVWDRAIRSAPPPPADPVAVVLATADPSGRPSARVVLLRGFDDEGFVFYTNYASRKARDLETNPFAALCFHWYWIEEQVRVEGGVVRASRQESDAYFASRPRGAQIGAWASKQSQPLSGRAELEARNDEFTRQFGAGPVPRPEFWGGYRLIPDRVEFWRAGESRLHNRLVYARVPGGWTQDRLYP